MLYHLYLLVKVRKTKIRTIKDSYYLSTIYREVLTEEVEKNDGYLWMGLWRTRYAYIESNEKSKFKKHSCIRI